MIKTRREIIMRFVFDLDGTICFRGKPLSLKMVEALDLLVAEGHDVSFASARPIRDLLPILPPHLSQLPMVGGNGAFVFKDGRAVAIHHFSAELAGSVRELLKRFEADYLADGDWNYSFLCRYEHPILKNVDPGKQARQLSLDELDTIVKVVVLGANDIPMFRAASRAICVGDHEEVKNMATIQVEAKEEAVVAAIHNIRVELQTQGRLIGRIH
jgi:hydroxymethylpyrimidine pyrophosphatase-like HAD family hydrolase